MKYQSMHCHVVGGGTLKDLNEKLISIIKDDKDARGDPTLFRHDVCIISGQNESVSWETNEGAIPGSKDFIKASQYSSELLGTIQKLHNCTVMGPGKGINWDINGFDDTIDVVYEN